MGGTSPPPRIIPEPRSAPPKYFGFKNYFSALLRILSFHAKTATLQSSTRTQTVLLLVVLNVIQVDVFGSSQGQLSSG